MLWKAWCLVAWKKCKSALLVNLQVQSMLGTPWITPTFVMTKVCFVFSGIAKSWIGCEVLAFNPNCIYTTLSTSKEVLKGQLCKKKNVHFLCPGITKIYILEVPFYCKSIYTFCISLLYCVMQCKYKIMTYIFRVLSVTGCDLIALKIHKSLFTTVHFPLTIF